MEQNALVTKLSSLDAELAVMVGSGLSSAAGMPSWTLLLNTFALTIDAPLIDEAGQLPTCVPTGANYYQFASYLAKKSGDGNLDTGTNDLKNSIALRILDKELTATPEIYEPITRLRSCKYMTLNYDRLLFQMFQKSSISITECTASNWSRPREGIPSLLYLHGRCDIAKNIVITSEDLIALDLQDDEVRKQAREWYRNCTVLHIGLGFADEPMIRLLVESALQTGSLQEPHYAIVTPEVHKHILESMNTTAGVNFCVVERDEIEPLLKKIADARQPSTQSSVEGAKVVRDVKAAIEGTTKPVRFENFPFPKLVDSPLDKKLVEKFLSDLGAAVCKIALIGPPAIGKTTLIQALGHRILDDPTTFKGGIIYVSDPSGGWSDAGGIKRTVDIILDDLAAQGHPAKLEDLPQILTRLQPVLVLDNLSNLAFTNWREELTQGIFAKIPVIISSQNIDLASGAEFRRHHLKSLSAEKSVELYCRNNSDGANLSGAEYEELSELVSNAELLGGLPGAIAVAARFIAIEGMSIFQYRKRLVEAQEASHQRNDYKPMDLLNDPSLTLDERNHFSAEALKAFSYHSALDVAFQTRFAKLEMDSNRARLITAVLGEYADVDGNGSLSDTSERHTQVCGALPLGSTLEVDEGDWQIVARELHKIGVVRLVDDSYMIPHPIRIYAQSDLTEHADFYTTRRTRLLQATRAERDQTAERLLEEQKTDKVKQTGMVGDQVSGGTIDLHPLRAHPKLEETDIATFEKRVRDFSELHVPVTDVEALEAEARAHQKLGNAQYGIGNFNTGAGCFLRAAEIFGRLGHLNLAMNAVGSWAYMHQHYQATDTAPIFANWIGVADRIGQSDSMAHFASTQQDNTSKELIAYAHGYMTLSDFGSVMFRHFYAEIALEVGDWEIARSMAEKLESGHENNRNRSIWLNTFLTSMLERSQPDWLECDRIADKLREISTETERDTALSAKYTLKRLCLNKEPKTAVRQAYIADLAKDLRAAPTGQKDQVRYEVGRLCFEEAMHQGDYVAARAAADQMLTTDYGTTSLSQTFVTEKHLMSKLLCNPDDETLRQNVENAANSARGRNALLRALELEGALLFSRQDVQGLKAMRLALLERGFNTRDQDAMITNLEAHGDLHTVNAPDAKIIQCKENFLALLPKLHSDIPTQIILEDSSVLEVVFPDGEYPQYRSVAFVTFEQYMTFMRATDAPRPVAWPNEWPAKEMADSPVVGLRHLEAHAYCRWLGLFLPRESDEYVENHIKVSEEDFVTFLNSKLQFSESVEVDTAVFSNLLANSLSLNADEKTRVIVASPTLSQFQIDELSKVFREEREKFLELAKDHPEDMVKLEAKKQREFGEICALHSLDGLPEPAGSHHARGQEISDSTFFLGLKLALPVAPYGNPEISKPTITQWRRDLLRKMIKAEGNRGAINSFRFKSLVTSQREETGTDRDALELICLFGNSPLEFEPSNYRLFHDLLDNEWSMSLLDLDLHLSKVAIAMGLEEKALQLDKKDDLKTLAGRVLMSNCQQEDLLERAYFLLLVKASRKEMQR